MIDFPSEFHSCRMDCCIHAESFDAEEKIVLRDKFNREIEVSFLQMELLYSQREDGRREKCVTVTIVPMTVGRGEVEMSPKEFEDLMAWWAGYKEQKGILIGTAEEPLEVLKYGVGAN